jgi:hypothetical protein
MKSFCPSFTLRVLIAAPLSFATPLTSAQPKAQPKAQRTQPPQTTHKTSPTKPLPPEKKSKAPLIELLPHQTKPIEYLYKNTTTKGLLINHFMGTGKTYLGIGFAEKYPDREIIIIAPRFIEAHWKSQIDSYGVQNPKRYLFISYNDAPQKLAHKDLSKSILLLDECHNIIRFLKSPLPDENKIYTELYEKLRSAYKILGLTGTPIYNDEYDLAYLFNLVSGENIVPFNEEEFRLKYTKIHPIRSDRKFFSKLLHPHFFYAICPWSLGTFCSCHICFGIFSCPYCFLLYTPWLTHANTHSRIPFKGISFRSLYPHHIPVYFFL